MLSPDHLVMLVVVLLLALVVFGPKRLPELGNSLGRAIQEFKHASQSATDEVRQLTALSKSEAPASSGENVVLPTAQVSELAEARPQAANPDSPL